MDRKPAQTQPKKDKTIEDRFLADLRANTHIERSGKFVTWHSEVKLSLADLMEAIPEEIRAAIEAGAK